MSFGAGFGVFGVFRAFGIARRGGGVGVCSARVATIGSLQLVGIHETVNYHTDGAARYRVFAASWEACLLERDV